MLLKKHFKMLEKNLIILILEKITILCGQENQFWNLQETHLWWKNRDHVLYVV